MQTPILGPFDVSRVPNLADNRLVNLYPGLVETKQGKATGALFTCPGLTFLARLGAGPITGMHIMNDVLYVISGGVLYQTGPQFTSSALNTASPSLNLGNGRASMIDNGTQLLSIVGAQGLLYDTVAGTTAPIIMPTPATATNIIAAYQDGFGLMVQPGSQNLWQSNNTDLRHWGGANFGQASGDSDNVVAVAQVHRELVVIKENHTEFWVNAGAGGFAFQRLDGAYLEIGCAAPYSVARVGETLMWLGQNRSGTAFVVQLTGYSPTRVSTHAIETRFQGFAALSDAFAYTYQQDGHLFYVLTFPTADETWSYDATDSLLIGESLWHQRATLTNGLFHRHPANVTAYYSGANIVGDNMGNLFKIDPAAATDNGVQRKWLRSWRALQRPSEEPVRFNSLQIDLQTGVTTPDGSAPQAMLRWSDDGGNTWSNELRAALGPRGATAQRVKFNRLGATRRSTGLDRIFELSSADFFPTGIIGATLQ